MRIHLQQIVPIVTICDCVGFVGGTPSPAGKQRITVRFDQENLDWFKD